MKDDVTSPQEENTNRYPQQNESSQPAVSPENTDYSSAPDVSSPSQEETIVAAEVEPETHSPAPVESQSPTTTNANAATTSATPVVTEAQPVQSEVGTSAADASDDPFRPIEAAPIAAAKKPKKKGLIIGGIIALVIVLLAAGGASAYKFWYQNPDKVLTDAVVNMIQAKSSVVAGKMTVKSASAGMNVDLTLDLNAKSNEKAAALDAKLAVKSGAMTVNLSAEAMADIEGNYYVKAKDVEQALNSFGAGTAMPPSITSFVKKVDNKWIKISADDIKELAGEESAKTQECITKASEKLKPGSDELKQVADLYKKHRFVTVKEELESQDGNLGYVLGFDEALAKEFSKGLSETTVMKELVACDESFKIDEDDLTGNDDSSTSGPDEVKFEAWVSRWGHELKKVNLFAKDETTEVNFAFTTQSGTDVSVEVPTDTMSLKELQSEIEGLTGAMSGAGVATPIAPVSPSASTFNIQ